MDFVIFSSTRLSSVRSSFSLHAVFPVSDVFWHVMTLRRGSYWERDMAMAVMLVMVTNISREGEGKIL